MFLELQWALYYKVLSQNLPPIPDNPFAPP
jgi:hypothetical protein